MILCPPRLVSYSETIRFTFDNNLFCYTLLTILYQLNFSFFYEHLYHLIFDALGDVKQSMTSVCSTSTWLPPRSDSKHNNNSIHTPPSSLVNKSTLTVDVSEYPSRVIIFGLYMSSASEE